MISFVVDIKFNFTQYALYNLWAQYYQYSSKKRERKENILNNIVEKDDYSLFTTVNGSCLPRYRFSSLFLYAYANG